MTENSATGLLPKQQAVQCLRKKDYEKACNLYQQAIEAEPEERSNYWNLGLALLLKGEEVEAQVTWMLVIGEGDEEQVEQWTAELISVLEKEAQRREEAEDYADAWAIRQHIREISPGEIDNILRIIQLSVKGNTFTGEDEADKRAIELLKLERKVEVNSDLLLQVLGNLLEAVPLAEFVIEFAEACLSHVKNPVDFITVLNKPCIFISHNLRRPEIAAKLTEFGLKLDPENEDIWRHLASYYQNAGDYEKGIESAKKCYNLGKSLADKVYANYLTIRGLMSAGGHWEEAVAAFEQQRAIIESMTQKQQVFENLSICARTYTTSYYFPYYRDNIKKNRLMHNQVARLCQDYIEKDRKEQVERYRQRSLAVKVSSNASKRLRIGYVSHCFGKHSVGWLARWLFKHHDRERYDIYGYLINYRHHAEDPLQEWFVDRMTQACKLGMYWLEAAEKIYEDEVDILVELDSLTIDIICGVMALKPAPVQVTWLGWDASGIPTIDYVISDPYVLPEDAQEHYREKIWRLPKTYVAVDGFEVAVPTLRRDRLDVESDAVLYYSSQRGFKRHPDTARLQLRIIKEVSNSYFLIKGFGDQDTIKTFFLQLAEEEGVSPDRLRFLSATPSEATHRANLGVADVVLDTYPYNGATTTLETLWMCVPLVTRVGEQFAARNSYTMMMNAGITEGIAWTDEEYVEWGVRLGEDPVLRQQISWRLRQSRQTAPLWNAKQFTREMENAYEQMWQKYVESGNGNR